MSFGWYQFMLPSNFFLTSVDMDADVARFRSTPVTYFPDTPLGNERFDYFRQVRHPLVPPHEFP